MERIYNKLVRDNIPNIIESKGEKPVFQILDDVSYKKELERKLFEEYNEVLQSIGDDRVEELADMLEIIRALAKLEGKSLQDVIDYADNKNVKRGAFEKKIYLEKVIEVE